MIIRDLGSVWLHPPPRPHSPSNLTRISARPPFEKNLLVPASSLHLTTHFTPPHPTPSLHTKLIVLSSCVDSRNIFIKCGPNRGIGMTEIGERSWGHVGTMLRPSFSSFNLFYILSCQCQLYSTPGSLH